MNFLFIKNDPLSGQAVPYVQLDRGLSAKLSRNVYYRLVDIAEQKDNQLCVMSGGECFSLGHIE